MQVVLTLTTIPSRLLQKYEDDIRACIESIVNQTYKDYEIHFNIPYTNKLTGEDYIIPEWLLEYEKIKIFRTEDIGPATKSVPTIERITDPEAIIIVCDDDLVYHEQMIEAHVENQKKHLENIIGYDGMRSRNEDGSFASNFNDHRDYYFTSQKMSSRVDILQHYKTISYKRRYFEDDFFQFIKDNYSWGDDLLLAAYFASKKRDRIVETHELIPDLSSYEIWSQQGGVSTFPVLRHTNHDSYEGCNIFRQTGVDDNHPNLYKFIDQGYIK